jgi:hypothetical protein
MREWIDIINLNEARVPPTEYGYWVLPDGSVHTVKTFDHDRLVTELLGEDESTFYAVVEEGWVRISCPNSEFVIQIGREITRKSRQSLYKIISNFQRQDSTSFSIEIIKQTGEEASRTFGRKLDVLSFLDSSIKQSSNVGNILEHQKLGKGSTAIKTSHRFLYHLTDYVGYSYAVSRNALKSKSQAEVCMTYNPQMNDVMGRMHYDFKFVFKAQPLIKKYGGHYFTDSFTYVGNDTKQAMEEDEIRLETNEITPVSDYLVGTILRFDLFTEKGLQWLLYPVRDKSGFLAPKTSAAPKPITMIIRQLEEWKKPIWIGSMRRIITTDEMRLLYDAKNCADKGLNFRQSFEVLANKHPIITHDGEKIAGPDVARMYKASALVKMLNDYYQDKPYNDVKISQVRNMLEQMIDTLGLGNNVKTVIIQSIEEAGLLHPSTAAVEWGGIISKLLKSDIDGALSTIRYYGKATKQNREYWETQSEKGRSYGRHVGTSFGRTVDF